jgi:hypothetical protein
LDELLIKTAIVADPASHVQSQLLAQHFRDAWPAAWTLTPILATNTWLSAQLVRLMHQGETDPYAWNHCVEWPTAIAFH